MSLALALAGVLAASPSPVRWSEASPAVLEQALEQSARLPFEERVVALSQGYLGTPYAASPLGEGQGKDPDPLIRYDAVDCLTFVEQSLAMALAPRPAEVEGVLRTLRYAKEPLYEDRNHLMEAQWLPNNLAHGFLRDITRELGGPAVVQATKILTQKTWTGKSAQALELPVERRMLGSFSLAMVPIAQGLEVAKKAPTGTVMVVVREDRPLLVTRVSHLGFVIQGKRPKLRHASRTFGKVVDEDLESFLSRNLNYARWTVSGLGFYQVRAPATP